MTARGLWITLEAGKIASARYTPATGAVTLRLDPGDATTPAARLFVESTTPGARRYALPGASLDRGGYTVPLSPIPTDISLVAR